MPELALGEPEPEPPPGLPLAEPLPPPSDAVCRALAAAESDCATLWEGLPLEEGVLPASESVGAAEVEAWAEAVPASRGEAVALPLTASGVADAVAAAREEEGSGERLLEREGSAVPEAKGVGVEVREKEARGVRGAVELGEALLFTERDSVGAAESVPTAGDLLGSAECVEIGPLGESGALGEGDAEAEWSGEAVGAAAVALPPPTSDPVALPPLCDGVRVAGKTLGVGVAEA